MALAKKVVLKGSTIEQYAPIGDHKTAKKPTTEIKNSIQYIPFCLLVISFLFICKYKAASLTVNIL